MRYRQKQNFKKLPRWLRIDQVNELFKVAKNERDKLLMEMLFYCGLRCSEALKLTASDFDFVSRSVYIRQSKRDKDRYVPIPKHLIPKIKKYVKKLDGKLFMLTSRHVRRIVKDYAGDAKIQNWQEVHPHTLRHSYATYLLDQGIPLRNIQILLGHADINMTTIYTHMSATKGREIIDKVFSPKMDN